MKKKKTIWIILGIITGAIVLVLALGIYRFNFTDDDIYYSGKGLQPESHKVFYGAWVEHSKNDVPEIGFILNPDSTAYSINAATLIYKKWKITNDTLILTSFGLGNHQMTVDDEYYPIESFNSHRLYLKRNEQEVMFEKVDRPTDNHKMPEVTFAYCPVEKENTTNSTKAEINWSSNSRANNYQTILNEAYQNQKINFAGHYQVVTWGCGSGVQEGVMIDTMTGHIYDLPTKKGFKDIGSRCENQPNSFLLITLQDLQNPQTGLTETERTYWIWHEKAKEFIPYK